MFADAKSSERNIVVEVHRRFVGRRRRGGLLRARLRAAAELIAALRLLRLAPAALLLTTGRCAACLLYTSDAADEVRRV